MKTITYTSELLNCEIGERVTLGRLPLTVLDKRYGRVFVEYDESYDGFKYWEWGAGGGSSLGNDLEKAKHEYLKCVQQSQQYWKSMLSNKYKGNIIVKRTHYQIGPKESNSSWSGFGGSKFVIRDLATGDVVSTRNLWHQGLIPVEFNAPDTHEFLSDKLDAPEALGTKVGSLNVEQTRIVERR